MNPVNPSGVNSSTYAAYKFYASRWLQVEAPRESYAPYPPPWRQVEAQLYASYESYAPLL